MIDETFWRGKRVFLTGHTGFKGSWLSLWLHALGAQITGYALKPPTEPSLFNLCRIDGLVDSTIADVRDAETLVAALHRAAPEIVIHMAAQPLVRDSYRIPIETYATNVMGTVHLFEAIRACPSVRAVVNVTTDKCYENREWLWGYRENEALGGYDPYSSSKACSELVTAAYRDSFFNSRNVQHHGAAIASARAGNVIGGGDWAGDRLIPDIMRAILVGKPVRIRNPHAIRPWQHVLEPLCGYLLLAERLCKEGQSFAEAWNFGPDEHDTLPVLGIVQSLCNRWGKNVGYEIDSGEHLHEASYLKLDSSKARYRLGWAPMWPLATALDRIVTWNQAYAAGAEMRTVTLAQINEYMITEVQ